MGGECNYINFIEKRGNGFFKEIISKRRFKMKKKAGFLKFLLVVVLFTILPAVAFADSYVSGPISSDTTWALVNSPYIVTGSVLVNSGVTLTIEPGVTVKFDTGKALQIDGTLIAKGNSNNKITFTSNQAAPAAGDWGYILFSNSSTDATYDVNGNYTGGSILEYAVVEYAGGLSISNNGAVRMDNAHPFINYCIIRNNYTTGISAANPGNLKIANSTIAGNNNSTSQQYGGGIYISGGTVTIFKNIISNNTASGWYSSGGIYISYSTTTVISNNIIINNISNGWDARGGGIYIERGSPTTVSNNIISDNTSLSAGGIWADSWWGNLITISNNTISNNYAQNACAIYSTLSHNTAIRYNTITGNMATVSPPTYTIFVSYQPILNFNNIFNNTATYDLWNGNAAGSANVNAENNWWGSAVESDIQTKIYDWIDDATKGFVDYIPWEASIRTDTPISPPTGLTTTAGSGTIALNWSANPESDVAGYKVYWDTDSDYPYANSVDVGNVTSYTIPSLTPGTYYVTVTVYDTSYNPANDDPNTIVNDNQTNGNESWYATEKAVILGGCIDNDGDGYGNPGDASCPNGSATDCDDNNAAIHPGATEICNGKDDDCDGLIDEGLPLNTYYRDADSDTYGNPNDTIQTCSSTPPPGYVANNTDCNDNDPNEHPGQTWYKDTDNDLYSNGTTNTTSCTRPAGYKVASELTATSGDCNDNNANIRPGVPEVCGNNIDDNCDGLIDPVPPCTGTGADLIISSLTAPLTGGAGKNITVTDTTKNQGTGQAGASTTKLYFSTDTTYSAGDTYLGSCPVPSLAAGTSNPCSITVTIPSVTCVDTYYIIAIADANGDVPETNENNNAKSKSIKIGSDLIVSSLSAPLSAAAGSTINVTDITKNSGADATGASTTKLYLSANTAYNPWDTYLNSRPVPSLAAGASSMGITSVTIPLGTPAGTYYIIVAADANGDVPETNEANNTKYKKITITP